MIERITGELIEKETSFAVVDCCGVGYGLNISQITSDFLPEVGAKVSLYTHLVVREDLMQLYGFSSIPEKETFLLLISVSKIGPKTALAALSGISVAAFVRAIKGADIATLTKIPGVGKQTAERLVVELKKKVEKLGIVVSGEGDEGGTLVSADMGQPFKEAILALESLGYKQYNAEKAVRKIYAERGADLSVAEIIKYALKFV